MGDRDDPKESYMQYFLDLEAFTYEQVIHRNCWYPSGKRIDLDLWNDSQIIVYVKQLDRNYHFCNEPDRAHEGYSLV